MKTIYMRDRLSLEANLSCFVTASQTCEHYIPDIQNTMYVYPNGYRIYYSNL